jgi:hypothetical protein
MRDTGSSPAHHYRRKYASVEEGSQAAAKSVKEDVEKTAQGNEEIPEVATEGRQGEPPHEIAFRIYADVGFRVGAVYPEGRISRHQL